MGINSNKVIGKSSLEHEKLSHCLAKYAQQAVLYEAILLPKPGLVDPIDAGSHHDMNIFTFIDSASSLYEGFVEFAEVGFNHKGNLKELFNEIRKIGIKLEQSMYDETKGVNTHKGVIFSLGLFISATAYTVSLSKQFHTLVLWNETYTNKVFETVKKMTEGIIKEDFYHLKQKEKLSNGEILYLKYGFLGIRGEAEAGYPLVRYKTLPLARESITTNKYCNNRELYLDILISLIAKTDDSTIVSRKGLEGLQYAKNVANDFMKNGGVLQDQVDTKLTKMNEEFVENRISPGGSADLLIVTIYLCKLEKLA